jgi:hypothetical protein
MFGNLTGPAAFLGAATLMLIIIPQEYIKKFLWMGIVGGFVLAILLLSIMQNVFGFWRFGDVDVVYIYNIPLTLSAVWIPLVIMFSYLVSTSRHHPVRIAALVAVFAAIAAISHWFLLTQGLLFFRNWSLLYTLILAMIIHVILYAYIQLASQVKPLR